MNIDWCCSFCNEQQVSQIKLFPNESKFILECSYCKKTSYLKIQLIKYLIYSSPIENEFPLYDHNATGW
jgi:hypothetical protein